MVDTPGEGKNRNRPARRKAAQKTPQEVDGRRTDLSPLQRRMQERALKHQRQFAENARILRTSYGWSQGMVAEKVGWHRHTIMRLESGDKCPSFSDVCILAEVLAVPMDVMAKDLSQLYATANAGTLPEALRSIRLAENLTQAQVADLCGISRFKYIGVESGKVTPDPELLAKLTRVFGRPIEFDEKKSKSA